MRPVHASLAACAMLLAPGPARAQGQTYPYYRPSQFFAPPGLPGFSQGRQELDLELNLRFRLPQAFGCWGGSPQIFSVPGGCGGYQGIVPLPQNFGYPQGYQPMPPAVGYGAPPSAEYGAVPEQRTPL